MKRLHIIYIPGVGDDRAVAQRLAIKFWRLWGVDAEVFPMHWPKHETWPAKRERLLARVDELVAQGHRVGLVGVSAGAAAAVAAYARRSTQLSGCVLAAGKLHHADDISQRYRLRSPDLVDAVKDCDVSLQKLSSTQRQRILSRYALHDGVVPRQDSLVEGGHNRQLLTIGHVATIATQLVLCAPSTIRFLRHA
jgi:hypothetical protein